MLIHASSTLVLRSSELISRAELVRLSSVLIRTASALEHLSRDLVGLSSVLTRPSSTVCGLLAMSFLAINNLVDLQGDHPHTMVSASIKQDFTCMLHTCGPALSTASENCVLELDAPTSEIRQLKLNLKNLLVFVHHVILELQFECTRGSGTYWYLGSHHGIKVQQRCTHCNIWTLIFMASISILFCFEVQIQSILHTWFILASLNRQRPISSCS